VINSHPSVKESAVIGVPSELGEDDVKIVIVLKENETLEYEDLMAFCEKRMAYFMIPRYVEFRESVITGLIFHLYHRFKCPTYNSIYNSKNKRKRFNSFLFIPFICIIHFISLIIFSSSSSLSLMN